MFMFLTDFERKICQCPVCPRPANPGRAKIRTRSTVDICKKDMIKGVLAGHCNGVTTESTITEGEIRPGRVRAVAAQVIRLNFDLSDSVTFGPKMAEPKWTSLER
jgi:hypothetical protein